MCRYKLKRFLTQSLTLNFFFLHTSCITAKIAMQNILGSRQADCVDPFGKNSWPL